MSREGRSGEALVEVVRPEAAVSFIEKALARLREAESE